MLDGLLHVEFKASQLVLKKLARPSRKPCMPGVLETTNLMLCIRKYNSCRSKLLHARGSLPYWNKGCMRAVRSLPHLTAERVIPDEACKIASISSHVWSLSQDIHKDRSVVLGRIT